MPFKHENDLSIAEAINESQSTINSLVDKVNNSTQIAQQNDGKIFTSRMVEIALNDYSYNELVFLAALAMKSLDLNQIKG